MSSGRTTPRLGRLHVASDELSTAEVPPLLGGRYRIEAMLGAGGMGSVYRVRDLDLEDVVALKIVGALEGAELARFRDEVKLARRVTHVNVARTFDIGEHAGVRFLTMEYVPGESLRHRLGRVRPGGATLAALVAGICEGIAAIHDANVVHGDLKPENVVVTPDGTPKVSDFGLATLRDANPRSRRAGTPPYMAPEQHLGAPASQRSDLYALGVILHELYSGKRPPDLDHSKLRGTTPVLSTLLPGSVAAIVTHCLDADPARRPRDAREVLAAIDRCDGVELAGRPSAPVVRAPREAVVVVVRALEADEPHDAYLGAALAGEVVRVLRDVRGLAIRAQPVAPGAAIDDVDAVVEGNVRRLGDRLQLALRLVSRREGYLLWARTITVDLVGLLGAVERASVAIADALGTRASRRPSSTLRDPHLIELYLRARDLDYSTWHSHDIDNAHLYKEILDQSPDDPLILASYSHALARRAIREPGALAIAQTCAERALALAPDLPEAHLALAMRLFIGNDIESALPAMVRGVELAPSSAFGQSMLGYALCEIGLVERGLQQLEFAISLERDLPLAWANSVRYHEVLGHTTRVDELVASPPQIREINTEWLYWVTRSRIAMARGDAAARALADELAATPYGMTLLLRPLVQALRRDQNEHEQRMALTPFFIGDPANHRVRALGFQYWAELAMYVGFTDIARDRLIQSIDEGASDLAWLDWYPLFDRFRREPWFVALRSRVAARAERARDAIALT